jgi:hypothetical protein
VGEEDEMDRIARLARRDAGHRRIRTVTGWTAVGATAASMVIGAVLARDAAAGTTSSSGSDQTSSGQTSSDQTGSGQNTTDQSGTGLQAPWSAPFSQSGPGNHQAGSGGS